MNDAAIEQAIQDKGLTAPRVTKEHIDGLMAKVAVQAMRLPGTNITIAVATLPDGFMVGMGSSACISSKNFDADLGASIAGGKAVDQARDKLWEMEGYLLRSQLGGVN